MWNQDPSGRGAATGVRCGPAAQAYRRWAVEALLCLDQLTAGIAAAHAGRDPRLALLREAYLEFEAGLHRHLAREARLQLAPPSALAGPHEVLAELERGDARLQQLLDRLAMLSDDFTPAAWASLDHRLMLTQLRSLAAASRAYLQGQRWRSPPGAH